MASKGRRGIVSSIADLTKAVFIKGGVSEYPAPPCFATKTKEAAAVLGF
jgi:hypothetical protein